MALLSAVFPHLSSPDGISWESMRAAGVGFWLKTPVAAQAVLASAGRAAVRAAGSGDPGPAAVYYIAAGQRSRVSALYKAAQEHRRAAFFGGTPSAEAAAKNGYALLSKGQTGLAAAAFLVGGGKKEAVRLLADRARDVQLALMAQSRTAACRSQWDATASPPVPPPTLLPAVLALRNEQPDLAASLALAGWSGRAPTLTDEQRSSDLFSRAPEDAIHVHVDDLGLPRLATSSSLSLVELFFEGCRGPLLHSLARAGARRRADDWSSFRATESVVDPTLWVHTLASAQRIAEAGAPLAAIALLHADDASQHPARAANAEEHFFERALITSVLAEALGRGAPMLRDCATALTRWLPQLVVEESIALSPGSRVRCAAATRRVTSPPWGQGCSPAVVLVRTTRREARALLADAANFLGALANGPVSTAEVELLLQRVAALLPPAHALSSVLRVDDVGEGRCTGCWDGSRNVSLSLIDVLLASTTLALVAATARVAFVAALLTTERVYGAPPEVSAAPSTDRATALTLLTIVQHCDSNASLTRVLLSGHWHAGASWSVLRDYLHAYLLTIGAATCDSAGLARALPSEVQVLTQAPEALLLDVARQLVCTSPVLPGSSSSSGMKAAVDHAPDKESMLRLLDELAPIAVLRRVAEVLSDAPTSLVAPLYSASATGVNGRPPTPSQSPVVASALAENAASVGRAARAALVVAAELESRVSAEGSRAVCRVIKEFVEDHGRYGNDQAERRAPETREEGSRRGTMDAPSWWASGTPLHGNSLGHRWDTLALPRLCAFLGAERHEVLLAHISFVLHGASAEDRLLWTAIAQPHQNVGAEHMFRWALRRVT
eukprot:CAMPEP_0170756534 /NCGR_PEP_ID=MMETSP0437-20130122/14074_1 /TAXON_ID=0 /ORGANISM="Sexangularia sp." /LENGTH=839 /DNA_ID=CAMNT_0011095719 /DNA_START=3 /DNA_END=2520 /DNA_ORIENTATION=+